MGQVKQCQSSKRKSGANYYVQRKMQVISKKKKEKNASLLARS